MKNSNYDFEENFLGSFPDLVQDIIYWYLGPKEQLALRRVSKAAKAWVESYSNRKCNTIVLDDWKSVQLNIYANSQIGRPTIEEFWDSKLENITNFYMRGSFGSHKGDEGTLLVNFMTIFGSRIRKLKLDLLEFSSDEDGNLFQYWPNLEDLEIKYLNIPHQDLIDEISPVMISCLRNLKRLKIKTTQFCGYKYKEDPNNWLLNPMKHCPRLEILQLPFLCLGTYHTRFIQNLINWLIEKTGTSISLKYLDMSNFQYYLRSSQTQNLPEFINLCVSNDIKLLNVETQLFHGINGGGLGNSILSIETHSTNPIFTHFDFLNLESIKVCFPHTNLTYPVEWTRRGSWPNLKSISLAFHQNTFSWSAYEIFESLAEMHDSTVARHVIQPVEVIMNSEVRPMVKNLELSFSKCDKIRAKENVSQKPPGIIQACSIARNFPNLVNLSIIGWDADDKDLVQLWNALPHLEDLRIDDCSRASDNAFIGDDMENPAFLKLTKLRKLTIGLKYMPRVTHLFFKVVLRRMELKEFVLSSGCASQHETFQGLFWLHQGKFPVSIEKFRFGDSHIEDFVKEHKIHFRSIC